MSALVLYLWLGQTQGDTAAESALAGVSAYSVEGEAGLGLPEGDARLRDLESRIASLESELGTAYRLLGLLRQEMVQSTRDGDSGVLDGAQRAGALPIQRSAGANLKELAGASSDGGRVARDKFSRDDWFWSMESNGDVQEPDLEGLSGTVVSQACRGEWCRLEVLETDTNSGDSQAEADLNLISELAGAIGRDVEVRYGESASGLRVIYVR
jgi:hypothetical protein